MTSLHFLMVININSLGKIIACMSISFITKFYIELFINLPTLIHYRKKTAKDGQWRLGAKFKPCILMSRKVLKGKTFSGTYIVKV